MKTSCYDIESKTKNVWKYIRLILALCLVIYLRIKYYYQHVIAVADPGGGGEGAMAPHGPVKISYEKDGRIDFMFLAPPYLATGSATASFAEKLVQ